MSRRLIKSIVLAGEIFPAGTLLPDDIADGVTAEGVFAEDSEQVAPPADPPADPVSDSAGSDGSSDDEDDSDEPTSSDDEPGAVAADGAAVEADSGPAPKPTRARSRKA